MQQDLFWNLLAKKLAKEASQEELATLEELMRDHPELLYSAQQIQDMWSLPSGKSSNHSITAFEQHLDKMQTKGVDITAWRENGDIQSKNSFFYRKIALKLLAAACFIGIIGIGIFKSFTPDHNVLGKNQVNEFSTHRGSKSKLKLPDGSIVWLNSGSKLSYDKDFGTGIRYVTLEGEAFFEVVKMPELPFIIQTKVIQIKVLGTAFNVKSYGDEPTTETSLIRGKVEITVNQRPEEKFILLPNNKLIVANETLPKPEPKAALEKKKIPLATLQELTYYKADSTIVETSWKENKLVFQDDSFADIAKKMERWYNVTIVFENANLEKERLTGSFTTETITQALEALQVSTHFQFKMNENTITIK